MNAYYNTAGDLGVTVLYDAEVTHVTAEGARVTGIEATVGGVERRFGGSAVVLAAGGFEANIDWLAEVWGPAARNFLIRGTPYNRGRVLRDMLDQGAETVGDPTQCHAVAIDGRAPKFDGGIVTRLDCVPFSVVVNRNGERFYDEGEDVWPKRYAIWGRLVAAQPEQEGFAIIDAKAVTDFMPSVYPPEEADTIEGLGQKLGLAGGRLRETIEAYNAACRPGRFDPDDLDGLSTDGLEPPKSNWARPIDTPPYYGYSLKTGVTFTYLGLKVDDSARVSGAAGRFENLWCAGEMMAGSILGQGYLAGFGMTIGTVFGRIAGREAAAHAR